MKMVRKKLLLLLAAIIFAACGDNATPPANSVANDPQVESLRADIKKIEPFFKPMGIPGRDDWLWDNKEPGQTFDEYISGSPTIPTSERKIIYVQPIGKFNAQQSQVIKTTSEYMEAFFGLNVKSLPLKQPPPKLKEPDQRMIDYPQHRQLRSGYLLDKVLLPALPKDAAALIAFTNEDLYPDTSMHFVFGQASLENRVGVWSLYRLDDQANFDTFLKRTMKIAVHETGHMFSMRHCTKYECVMSGTNHIGETDRRPIDACPECMAKIAWMNKEKPLDRYNRLVVFAKKYRLTKEAADFEKKEKAVN
jgi:archaemetzincin